MNSVLSILRLARTENIGPVTFKRLIERFQTAENSIAALPELAGNGGRKLPLHAYSEADAEKELNALQKLGGTLITCMDPRYPPLLKNISDAPIVLSCLGDVSLLQKDCLAFVGARNASLNGKKLAGKLAQATGKNGFVIVSGLARGIDTAVHQASIGSGTIGVVAGGVDIIYPPENEALFTAMRKDGLIVSEQPLGMMPLSQHFPRRNRIISGLSKGVVVVEAGIHSGSLITARTALDQNRELFAVPGFPGDPRAAGPNRLLKDGAYLVESEDDILSVLNSPKMIQPYLLESPQETIYYSDAVPDDFAREVLLSELSSTPVCIDELSAACQMKAGMVHAVLLELELAERIIRVPGNRVCLREE